MLLMYSAASYETKNIFEKIEKGEESDESSSYIFDKLEIIRREIYKKPEVLKMFKELYKLYIKLLENKKIKELTFKPCYERDEDTERKFCILCTIVDMIAYAHQENGKYVLSSMLESHYTLYPGMPNPYTENVNNYYYIPRMLKDEIDPQKYVRYWAGFKIKNGEISLVNIKFELPDSTYEDDIKITENYQN